MKGLDEEGDEEVAEVIILSKSRFPCFLEGDVKFRFQKSFKKTFQFIVFKEDDYSIYVTVKNELKKTVKIYKKVLQITHSNN